jgi:hypothetical protein
MDTDLSGGMVWRWRLDLFLHMQPESEDLKVKLIVIS